MVRDARRIGVRLRTAAHDAEITFDTSGELGGHLVLKGASGSVDTVLSNEVTPQVGIVGTTSGGRGGQSSPRE